jgi:hypothetical protein
MEKVIARASLSQNECDIFIAFKEFVFEEIEVKDNKE